MQAKLQTGNLKIHETHHLKPDSRCIKSSQGAENMSSEIFTYNL